MNTLQRALVENYEEHHTRTRRHHNMGALKYEAKSVSALGMTYVYSPVDFESPTDENFDKFCKVLAELKDEMMDGIWRPGNDWAAFIGSKDAIGKANLYAGDDY